MVRFDAGRRVIHDIHCIANLCSLIETTGIRLRYLLIYFSLKIYAQQLILVNVHGFASN